MGYSKLFCRFLYLTSQLRLLDGGPKCLTNHVRGRNGRVQLLQPLLASSNLLLGRAFFTLSLGELNLSLLFLGLQTSASIL